ncbi:28S ribosomal protein S36, mitochondrial-like [Megalops cyprinoides]|uniref:28S ribosomal protein S36, mitochondrial-like n=1 Tax=Megalops cyprinoides TaxID=118141 RepID=UPI001864AB3D|nr:28S ribosomal protein S36, mitochondrial-like [Megalops cyprinoides]
MDNLREKGWKVTKMAAATRVVIQAVRPHAPLIKFPNRLGVPRPKGEFLILANNPQLMLAGANAKCSMLVSMSISVQEALKIAAPPQSSGTHSLPQSVASTPRPVAVASVASPSRDATPPDTAATAKALPQKYRRRTLAVEEMDYIQRGGPE